ncbi:hypothetical protein ENTCAN_05435 [Enterobacter cancerogenus ATCC 35316]|nr:hypothetical protein ENTCAN_05435 [Enterobacter cancerogenus ATCC 35316]
MGPVGRVRRSRHPAQYRALQSDALTPALSHGEREKTRILCHREREREKR